MRTRIMMQVFAIVVLTAIVSPLSVVQAQDQGLAQIRGVLLDAEGMPAVGHQIGLKSATGDLMLSAPTGADGHFVLSQLPPGRYEIVAYDADGAEFPIMSDEVALEPGQIARLEVRISGAPHPPGRTRPAAAPASSGGGFRGLSTLTKVGIVVGGAFAVALALDSDDDPTPSVSPSVPLN